MAVSYTTVEKVISVVRKHVDQRTFENIVSDLKSVPGNQSFRDTINRLEEKLNGNNR